MAAIKLKKVLSGKVLPPILQHLAQSSGGQVAIWDADHRLLLGEAGAATEPRVPIRWAEETIGWVSGQGNISAIAGLLEFLAVREQERRQLADEALEKYKEINLFYRLSEKISSSLDLAVVSELIIEEARQLIKTTSGSVMLFNEATGMLDIVAAFGQATGTNVSLKPGDGIAGSVFASGKGEIVNDVLTDKRFVPGKNRVSSIICAPLKTRDRAIGVVNFSHDEPITYTAGDLQLLSALASQAAQAIENARLHESKIKDAIARYEIEKGQKMQMDFLPESILQPPGWSLAATFRPARQVAGDFYDTFALADGYVGLAIADVCDKGVGSALFMALFRSLIRVFSGQTQLRGRATAILEEFRPKDGDWLGESMSVNLAHVNALQAVVLTNDYVAQNHSNLNMFATMFFGILDPSTGLLTYINGGHEPLAIVNANGIRARLKPTGPAVGMMPNMKFRIQQARLEPGEILIGFTDGVTEAKAPDGSFFGEGKLLPILQQPCNRARDMLDRIEEHLIAHMGDADQFDDITMLAVQRLPDASDS